MTDMRCNSPVSVVIDFTELVRGQDQKLLEQLNPMVGRQSISLDLSNVERIDAAGLAALIKLYCAAREAGHSFTVFNPSPHVAQILALVHLDGLLVSKNPEECPRPSLELQESAA